MWSKCGIYGATDDNISTITYGYPLRRVWRGVTKNQSWLAVGGWIECRPWSMEFWQFVTRYPAYMPSSLLKDLWKNSMKRHKIKETLYCCRNNLSKGGKCHIPSTCIRGHVRNFNSSISLTHKPHNFWNLPDFKELYSYKICSCYHKFSIFVSNFAVPHKTSNLYLKSTGFYTFFLMISWIQRNLWKPL